MTISFMKNWKKKTDDGWKTNLSVLSNQFCVGSSPSDSIQCKGTATYNYLTYVYTFINQMNCLIQTNTEI